MLQQAKAAVAAYLGRVRCRPGLLCSDGLDLLLLQLLCDVGDAAAVEALVSSAASASSSSSSVASSAAAAGDAAGVGFRAAGAIAERVLAAAGRWHALALLHMAVGQPQEALATWQVR